MFDTELLFRENTETSNVRWNIKNGRVIIPFKRQRIDGKAIRQLLKIVNIIKESQNDEKGLLNTDFLLELHCVAVCYDENSKKILIMKRASSKPKHKYPDC